MFSSRMLKGSVKRTYLLTVVSIHIHICTISCFDNQIEIEGMMHQQIVEF